MQGYWQVPEGQCDLRNRGSRIAAALLPNTEIVQLRGISATSSKKDRSTNYWCRDPVSAVFGRHEYAMPVQRTHALSALRCGRLLEVCRILRTGSLCDPQR